VAEPLPRNPLLDEQGTYPFVRLNQAKAAAAARGIDIIDLGVGEPREATPAFIVDALVEALRAEPVSSYPLAVGLPELREAAAAWLERRFGARIDPEAEIIPTYGSKEAIFSLAQVLVQPGRGDVVAVTTPGYPVPARGAAFAGAEVVELPLTAERGWLPDLDAVPWERLTLLWVNSPGNPTGAVAPLHWLEDAAARCRAHGAVLASDEAYCELYFGEPPPSALQLPDRSGVLAFHTLSKRSSMVGHRSGFVAGDAELVGLLRRFRPSVGTAPQAFVQRASIAAWGDEAHVEEARARYAAKRAVLLPALREAGLELVGGDASFFLWLRVPGGDDEGLAARWLEHGVVAAPGSYLGAGGEGHLRVALVPTVEACMQAAAVVASLGA
jgi:succinyldiaminopimelate transaminase